MQKKRLRKGGLRSGVVMGMVLAGVVPTWAAPAPIKVLLITGGGWHDYGAQKNALKTGIEARAVCTVTQYAFDNSNQTPFAKPGWAAGYDAVIHDYCQLWLPDWANAIAPHQSGLGGVFLHCAMHSCGMGSVPQWGELCGIGSNAHGPNGQTIKMTYVDKTHPITQGAADWTTPAPDELYNNAVKVYPSAHELAHGNQKDGNAIVMWTNTIGSGKVFATTIGHENATVADARYLDIVTRGLLWTCGKLNADYLKMGVPPNEPSASVVRPVAAQGNARAERHEFYTLSGKHCTVLSRHVTASAGALLVERRIDEGGTVYTSMKMPASVRRLLWPGALQTPLAVR